MATFNTLYTTAYDYTKLQGVDGAKPRTYNGTVLLAAGLTQKNGNTYPLLHAKDIQLGQDEAYRLTDKLAFYDTVLREIYGDTPAELETQNLASLAAIAAVLNNDSTTIDDRIIALRMFKTIAIAAQSTNTTELTTNTESLVAANNNDTLTFATGNKWVRFAGTNKTLTVAHAISEFTPTTNTIDLNSSGTFDLPILSYDAAGHIIGKVTTTYTLPYNWKSITTANNATATSELTTSDATIAATTQVDTVTLSAANKWIRLAASNKQIQIAHARSSLTAGEHASNYSLVAQTPDFGASFNILIPSISFTTDEAGHVTAQSYSSSTTSVTLPSCSLTDTDTGNVVIGLSLTANTGAFVLNKAYISNLTLTDYNVVEGDTIVATDTLKSALSKLATRIYTVENNLSTESQARSDGDDALQDAIDLLNSDATTEGSIAYALASEATTRGNADTALSDRLDTIENDYLVAASLNPYLASETAALTYQPIEDTADPYATTSEVQAAVNAAIQQLLNDYSLTLIAPTVTINEDTETAGLMNLTVSQFNGAGVVLVEELIDTTWTIISDSITAIADAWTFTYTTDHNGTYRAKVTRTYNSSSVDAYSSELIISDIPAEPEEP